MASWGGGEGGGWRDGLRFWIFTGFRGLIEF